jgi:hypothetical protein
MLREKPEVLAGPQPVPGGLRLKGRAGLAVAGPRQKNDEAKLREGQRPRRYPSRKTGSAEIGMALVPLRHRLEGVARLTK